MSSGGCFDLVCQENNRANIAHSFAVVNIFHERPVPVAAQLLKCVTSGKDALVAGVAPGAKRPFCDVLPNASVQWSGVVEAHPKSTSDRVTGGITCLLLHYLHQFDQPGCVGNRIRVQEKQNIAPRGLRPRVQLSASPAPCNDYT